MVASIIKTTQLDKVPSIVNIGASGGMGLIRWGYTENVIIIITSSVPCIRPLFVSSVRKVSSATRSWSHELSAAADRRSKNPSSSKSTSRNTWSKGESSTTRQDTPAKMDEETGDAGYGSSPGPGGPEVEELGVARGWPEEYIPDYHHGYHSSTASGSASKTASIAPSRPDSETSGGITKQVGFSVVSSEGDSR